MARRFAPGGSSADALAHLHPLFRRLERARSLTAFSAVRPLDLSRPVDDPPLRVSHLTSLTSEAYLRLLHPIRVVTDTGLSAEWSWARVAEREVTPGEALAHLLSEARPRLESAGLKVTCSPGVLPGRQASILAAILSSDPTEVHFMYFWDGLGFHDPGPHVYDGSPALVGCLYPRQDAVRVTPTLWWGSSREWFVATHPDATSTYIGGSSELVRAVLEDPDLEAQAATSSTPLDIWR
jgi:hypothetical protein